MKRKLLNRIENTLATCTAEEVRQGLEFYERHAKEIRAGADELEVDPEVYAKIVSVLSPYNRWENNISDAHRLIFALKYEPEQVDKLTFTTFRSNVEKAIKVFHGEADLTVKSPKTHGFYKNLTLDPEHVTIDRHMLKIVDLQGDYGVGNLSPKVYEDIADHFRFVAKKHNLKPFELQAILWFNLRGK